jgi:hypothetical protein
LTFFGHGLLELVDLDLGAGAAHSPGDVDNEEGEVEKRNVDGIGSPIHLVIRLGGEQARVLIPVTCCRLDEFKDNQHERCKDANSFETIL